VYRDEAVSGKDTDREMFQKLLTHAEGGALDVVVFWKLDRFSRSLMHAVQLEREFREWDVALHSVTEQIDTTTPTGRFNFRNISSASEFERDLNKQRSRMGMNELALEHKWPNDLPPLGYNKCSDSSLEIDPEEAETVRFIFERYIELHSMPELAEELNDRGISTRDGKKWTPRGVSDVLQNELYTGQYSVADVDEHVPEYQLLDDELFERVTDIRMRFQSDSETADRGSMTESRKQQHVRKVVEQFQDFLDQKSLPED
jgi:site-specific DNA recombinase